MKYPTVSKSMLAAMVAASSLATGIAHAQAEVKGEITFYTNRTDLVEAGVYERYTEMFREKYPEVTDVKVIGFADYQGGLRPRMNTGDYGDIVLILPSVPAEQYGTFYEPLDMYQADEVYFHDAWSHDGKNYGISMGNSVEGLVYNKEVFAEADIQVPFETLDEMYAAAGKIAELGKTPFYINFGAQWPLQQWDKFPIVAEGDEDVYEKMLTQEQPFSGDTAYRQSLTVLKTLIDNKWTERDLMTNSWEESKTALASGQAGMFYLGHWCIPQVIERGIDSDKIGFMPIPGDNSGELRAQMNHDWGYAVSRHSDNKDTAKAYIRFLLEESDFDEIAGFIPTVKSREPSLPQLNEYMSYEPRVIQTPVNSSTFIAVTNRSQIDFYSGGYIQDIITGRNFEDSLERLDARWNRAKNRVMR